MTMKISSIFLLFVSFTLYCSQAFSTDIDTPVEESVQTEIKKMLDTEVIRSPYYTKILLRSLRESAQKDNQNKTEIMENLKQTMSYSDDEFQKLLDNFESNPPINYNTTLNSDNNTEAIKRDPVEAFYQLSIQKELNPDFFKNLQKKTSKSELSPAQISQSKSIENSVESSSDSVVQIKPQKMEQKRLGKKSFNINPDLFY